MKDPFEQEFRDLPWRRPSPELRDRLFAQPVSERRFLIPWLPLRPVPLSWAAAIIILAGFLGYGTWEKQSTVAGKAQVHIVDRSAGQHIFDFSLNGPDVWPNSLELKVVAPTIE